MASIWQRLTGTTPKKATKVESPELTLTTNLLKLKIGESIRIDTIELSKEEFKATGIRNIVRVVNGTSYPILDYLIESENFKNLRLRAIPDGTFILLNLLSDFKYDKIFHDGLNDPANKGEMEEKDENQQPIIYNRINDLKKEWNCNVTLFKDNNTQTFCMDYWDYWRTEKDDAGHEFQEFYIVELNKDDGYFEVWLGPEIQKVRVSKL